MRQARRFDFGELKSATRTPQGFLMCPGFATRCGVFPYKMANGQIRRELRHPDDVLDPKSIATLKNAVVTVEHPPVMLNPKNVAQYRKGHTGERVEVNRDMIDVDLIIEDQDAIDAVEKNGMRELSSGYDADIVEEEGTYNGAPYDFRQKNIVYNHVAIVKNGRAGPEVRLRLDSADAVMQSETIPRPAEAVFSQESGVVDAEESGKTKKVVVLGREVDLPSDVADAVQDMMDRFDEMRAKQSILEDEMSTKARTDKKDVDINQKGVSPQVKVEQQGPDGRSAPGKTKAAPGTITGGPSAKADDEEEEKGDEDEHGVVGGVKPNSKSGGEKALKDASEDPAGHEDDEPASEKGGGAAQNPVDRLKKDMEEKQGKHDAEMAGLQKKMDEFASASQNQPEKKPDGEKMDSADVQKMVRARAKLERQAEKLVPFSVSKRFDSMSDSEILAAVIKTRSPKADLEGKGHVYLQSRFDSIVESLEEEGTNDRQRAGKALLGAGGARFDAEERADSDPEAARRKMISDTREMYKQPLAANKK